MRATVVVPQVTGRGGMETATLALDRAFGQVNVEVLWMFSRPASLDPDWVDALASPPVYYGPDTEAFGYPVFDLAMSLGRTFVRLKRPDVVLVTTLNGLAIYGVARTASMAFGRNGPPMVSWQRASLVAAPERDRGLVRFMDAHIAVSTGIAEELEACDPGKPVALTGSPVPSIGERIVPRATVPTFLYIGRLDVSQKRLDRLFRALAGLGRRRFRLRVFGAAAVGDARQEADLHSLAGTLGIADRIEWMGWRQDPWAYVQEATVLVLTSDYEGFGLVLPEALGRGIPVIASDCPSGPRDIVQSGVNGYLFPPQDELQLRRLLRGVVDGTLPLPDAPTCTRSVERFRAEAVAQRFADALARWSRELPAASWERP